MRPLMRFLAAGVLIVTSAGAEEMKSYRLLVTSGLALFKGGMDDSR
jgi:hypothetical protein